MIRLHSGVDVPQPAPDVVPSPPPVPHSPSTPPEIIEPPLPAPRPPVQDPIVPGKVIVAPRARDGCAERAAASGGSFCGRPCDACRAESQPGRC